jgi:hypothetical protein
MIKRLFHSLQKKKTAEPVVFDPESVLKIFVPAPGSQENEAIRLITIADHDVVGMHLQDIMEVISNLHNAIPTEESFAELGLRAITLSDIPQEYRPQYEAEIQGIRNSYAEAGTHTGSVEAF